MSKYLMENADEDLRLELKTDTDIVKRQAAAAGIVEGMKVLDVGCGVGKTTAALAELVGPNGSAVGIDNSPIRLKFAETKYRRANTAFKQHDITTPFLWFEQFDAIWCRFILEYFRSDSLEVLANITPRLKPGGKLVLVDSDQNSMIHYGANERLITTLRDIMNRLARDFNFDPYAGGRLPGYLQELGYTDIQVSMEPHHLIYGEIDSTNAYNWMRKLELVAEKSGCCFESYAGPEFAQHSSGYAAFREEFKEFFSSPRRFTYTPLIIASGTKRR